MIIPQDCPCGRKKHYVNCCGKSHQNVANAETAEDLVRSRYTAFVLADGDYLMESHHSSTRPSARKKELVQWAKSVKWLKLEIINTTAGAENDDEGTVEFKAHFKDRTKPQFIHQNAKFVREYGCWAYLDVV